MIKVAFSPDKDAIWDSAQELKRVAGRELMGCINLLQTSYLEGDITCTLAVDERQARFTIAGSEGIFKDVFLPLNKSIRFYEGNNYAFLCSLEKKLIFTFKKDSFTEGSKEELLGLIGAHKETQTETEIAAQKAYQTEQQRQEQRRKAEKFYSQKEVPGHLSKSKEQLKSRFRVQKYFAVAFAIIFMIRTMDPVLFHHVPFDPRTVLLSGLMGLVAGFFFSFTYTFFRAWFDNQKEKVKVGSIALFFVTFPAFTVMGILGAIPYSVYQLVDGQRTGGVTKVINIAAPIFMGLVVVLEAGLLFLIFSIGMFL